MADKTTLAESLSHIFSKLHSFQSNQSLWEAWKFVFGGHGRADMEIMECIGTVCSAILTLNAQLDASKRITAAQKTAASLTLSSLQKTLEVTRFSVPFAEFRESCNVHICGNLGFIGNGLSLEFGEPHLEDSDTKTILNALNELRDLLLNADIDIDLLLALQKQVEGMIWWLSHPEMMSIQNFFQSTGSALAVAAQVKERDPEKDTENTSKSKDIFEKMNYVAIQAYRIINFGYRVAGALEQLPNEAPHLQGILRSLS